MIVLDLYFARHGQSYGNLPGSSHLPGSGEPAHYVPLDQRLPGIDPGLKDWRLTPLGQRQAQALGERLAGIPFDAIYCSPHERARATAQAIVERQPHPVELKIEPDVVEVCDCNGETPEHWRARALRAARALRNNASPGARVLVVSHAGFGDFLLHALFGLPGPDHLFRFGHTNTGLTRVIFYGEDSPAWDRVRLYQMNDTSHLTPELISS